MGTVESKSQTALICSIRAIKRPNSLVRRSRSAPSCSFSRRAAESASFKPTTCLSRLRAAMAVLETVVSRPSGILPSSHSQVGSLCFRLSFSDDPRLKDGSSAKWNCHSCKLSSKDVAASSARLASSALSVSAAILPVSCGSFSSVQTAIFHECSAAKRLRAFLGRWCASSMQ